MHIHYFLQVGLNDSDEILKSKNRAATKLLLNKQRCIQGRLRPINRAVECSDSKSRLPAKGVVPLYSKVA